ncbi:hypothetical protein Spith_1345 [Spirochaeta thermophila DSM 6578]|uniref:PHP domain protein n=1 Tax=Winmispira thermophila (strain ATCC 700085 / DSM 6578 / Z-1203) TaxID=869211 RepID=G0GFR6_WINT7|nr:hypothetical protein [Spirochaeta thermophila]AEJ61609.1 hypothetical protein Spith_1345 [Spirochaeta thermophila DSM 6578]
MRMDPQFQKKETLRERINSPGLRKEERLEALSLYLEEHGLEGRRGEEVNNHIHTCYSFSPYTPSMAALRAAEAGLAVAGSVDHDSLAAAEEMVEASRFLGLGGIVGFELRVSFRNTPFGDRKLNNPDLEGVAYITVQGIPSGKWKEAEPILGPVREARARRTERMVARLGALLEEKGMPGLQWEEVVSLSCLRQGGTITERHLLMALAHRFVRTYGRGGRLVEGLVREWGLDPGSRLASYLSDPENPYLEYDLLGVLKAYFLERIYVSPDEDECPPVERVLPGLLDLDGVVAYAYLGDVKESPTGDKRAETFEDAFLDELIPFLKDLGFQAVTYMPPRNTRVQLERVQALCRRYELLEISGVDINSPRQSFNCPDILGPEYRHLIDTTWALVGHQRVADLDPSYGLFSSGGPFSRLPFGRRIEAYARVGREAVGLRSGEDVAALVEKMKREVL